MLVIHFVLGGARSGKSSFAEQQVLELTRQQDKRPVYLATATNIDDEMTSRIVKHQADRGNEWQLLECPLVLAETIPSLNKSNIYLLDCLTLWLNNQLYGVIDKSNGQQKQHLQAEIDKLLTSLSNTSVDIVIVSNEVGLGVIPMGESTRLYVDYCGWLNQGVAKIADKVTLVTAGIPLTIKS